MNGATAEPGTVGELLKRCRQRLSSNTRSLGVCVRAPVRIGKTVTQEEVAEAAGISRVWYATMENDRATRVSVRVLEELANVLQMEPSEHATLFRLALPELRSASLSERSAGMLDAFASIRRFMRRLSGVSSTLEALRAARELLMLEVRPAAAVTFRKNERGQWTLEFIDDDGGDRVARALELIRERFGSAGIDDLHCLTIMTRPGELIARSDRDKLFPKLAAQANDVLASIDLSSSFFTMAHVQGDESFIARLSALYNTHYALSDLECAQLSTIAELTSFALQGQWRPNVNSKFTDLDK
jgi:transcriptional regulator with XRE-family HTH domain